MANIWNLAVPLFLFCILPNDELALKNQLSSLESSWSSLDGRLDFWTLTVVIGVAVELVVIVVEHRRAMHDFTRGVIHSPDRPSKWLLAFALLGAGLVAIGVAGEFGIHIKAGKVETEMRNVTARLVAIADQKADEANNLAAVNERDAQQLKSENLKLEAQVQPRTIDESDRKKLAKILQPFTPSFKGRKVKISSQIGDAEGMLFALEIMDVLSRAGIDVDTDGMGRLEGVGGVFMGATVTGPP
jgi:hypothetical protein